LKFDHLIQKMFELNCDYIATGHYAQIGKDVSGGPSIVVSTDEHKDQTYFLFTLKPDILTKVLFPIGHLTKSEVRKIAEEKQLVNARKKDSTGICFVGKQGYAGFVASQVGADKIAGGLIKRFPTGEVLGTHTGIHGFTYGQRRGLGMSHHETLYVLSIDPTDRTVWVGDESHLFRTDMEIKQVNWLSEVKEDSLTVKIRYQHKGATGIVEKREDGKYFIKFNEPQRAITPGQAAVFYRENQLVGGGWIV
jgi:tRNA-specific 2-thiouridylase